MNLQEYNQNQIVKELNEVERYLLRILQRYFTIEEQYSKEVIESIIIESLTRFKQSFLQEKGFLFCLNHKTGHIHLQIQDFNGEPIIQKKSAFNKDFGTEQNTACEGNDSRLSDARIPLNHTHNKEEIKELIKQLTNLKLSVLHTHYNQKTLNILNYTGKKETIDLAFIEILEQSLKERILELEIMSLEITSIKNTKTIQYQEQLEFIKEQLKSIRERINHLLSWIFVSYQYTNDKLTSYQKELENNYILTETDCIQLSDLLQEKSYYLLFQKEIVIPKKEIVVQSIKSNESIIREQILFSVPIDTKILLDFQNAKEKGIYLKIVYDKDNQKREVQLPCIQMDDNYTIFYFNYEYTEDGTLSFYCYSYNIIPFQISETKNLYNNTVFRYIEQRNLYQNSLEKKEQFALIDSKEKLNFIKQYLNPNIEYIIQGTSNFEEPFQDEEGSQLTFFDWAEQEPLTQIWNFIVLDTNGKMKIGSTAKRYGCIKEYPIKGFYDFFPNGKIICEYYINKGV